MKLETRLIHHPGAECRHTGAVSTPIYQSSTFRQKSVGEDAGYDYSRTGNPTRDALEAYIGDLEGGVGGAAFGSGMGAVSSSLMLLQAGAHLVATEGLYGGTYRVLRKVFYPGLPSHPHHATACRLMDGWGGVVSFVLDSDFAGTCRFIDALEIPCLAPSLGGVESLVEPVVAMGYWDDSPANRELHEIEDGLVRLALGVEDVQDVIHDLDRAFERMSE